MDYKTGSYIIYAKKTWKCEHCCQDISPTTKHFARVIEGEEKINSLKEKYTEKFYKRYHLNCALQLKDLSDKEQILLQHGKTVEVKPKISEPQLQQKMVVFLKNKQDQGTLVFYHTYAGLINFPNSKHSYHLGNKGFADFIIFLPNKILFVEVKNKTGVFNIDQVKFIQMINNLGYKYFIVDSLEGLDQLITDSLKIDLVNITTSQLA